MSESIAWPEGSIYLWTGTATASALVAYGKSINATIVYGIDNYQTFDTAYHNNHTGQRADLSIGTLYTVDNKTLQIFADAKTAVHMHLKQTGVYGSAGYFFYSGAIDGVSLAGQDAGLFQWSLQLHSNRWSAY